MPRFKNFDRECEKITARAIVESQDEIEKAVVARFGAHGHSAQCSYHCDQYEHECDCGATRPALRDWAERELMAAEDNLRRAKARVDAAIARRDALASVGRNPEGHDRATGHGRNDEHAVPSETSADAIPSGPLNHPIKE